MMDILPKTGKTNGCVQESTKQRANARKGPENPPLLLFLHMVDNFKLKSSLISRF